MSNVVRVSCPAPLPPAFLKGYRALNAENRHAAHANLADDMEAFVRRYILSIAPQNHKTANSFTPPATPTGHLEDAVNATHGKPTANGAVVSVASPGITRAFHPLQIRAKDKLLTIPARPSPEAYGRRAREVGLTERLFFAQTKSGVKMLATKDDLTASVSRLLRRKPPKSERPHRTSRTRPKKPDTGNLRPVYWLRSAVTVPQKRDILPSDAALAQAAKTSLKTFIHAAFA
jgi:hypothetical protein